MSHITLDVPSPPSVYQILHAHRFLLHWCGCGEWVAPLLSSHASEKSSRVPEFQQRSTNLAIYSITILVSEKNVNMVWSACITYSCLIRTASRQSRSLVSHNASHSSRMSTATARKSSQFDCSDPLPDLNMPAILIKRNAGLTLYALNAMRSNS